MKIYSLTKILTFTSQGIACRDSGALTFKHTGNKLKGPLGGLTGKSKGKATSDYITQEVIPHATGPSFNCYMSVVLAQATCG